jgi:hypothetical protein
MLTSDGITTIFQPEIIRQVVIVLIYSLGLGHLVCYLLMLVFVAILGKDGLAFAVISCLRFVVCHEIYYSTEA